MPTYQLLTDRTLAQSSAITPTTLIHIVYTGDPSQNIAGSSFKAQLGQLAGLFSGGSVSGDYLPLSGGTVSGSTNFTNGLTANTISATTYLNLPLDIRVTGGTYSAGTATFTNNTGGTFNVTGFTTGTTSSVSGDYLPLSGGTVTGGTIFQSGLTANTISATTYQNLPLDIRVTGGTYSAGTATFTNNTGGTFNVTGFTTGTTTSVSGDYLPLSGGTVSGATNFTNGITTNTMSASTLFVNGVQITGDTYVTGLTFNTGNYNLTIGRNDGVTFTDNLGVLASDNTITGGTYNSLTGVGTFTNNTGGTFNVSGFLVGYTDVEVTGSTYNNNTFTFTNSTGGTFDVLFNTVTGLTSTGLISSDTISATTYQNLPPFVFTGGTVNGSTNFTNGLTANTISATTYLNLPQFSGGSGNCITDLYVTNVHGCSPITIYDSIRSTGSTVLGQSSISFGFQTSATTSYSHSEGQLTLASGYGSHAEGESTLASGSGSHTEGFQTSATTTYAHAEGQLTLASGNASHAEGSQTTASGGASHAEGIQTTTLGSGSHAEGSFTTSSGQSSHAEGSFTISSGLYSHSEGELTVSSGRGSHAEGYGSQSLSDSSHAEGYYTITSGQSSHAEGVYTYTSGYGSHAEGGFLTGVTYFSGGTAIGGGSHAEGRETISSGISSHAEGHLTVSSGNYSHAEGHGTYTSGDYQHATGKWNLTGNTTQGAFIVGNGSDALNRSNLIFAANSGVTITGTLTATTISATTYQNLPLDIRITGATYSNNTFTHRNNTGGTYTVLFNTVTGLTVNGNLTVTGSTDLKTLTATTTTINGNLTVTGSTNLKTLTATTTTINGNLTVTGSTNLKTLTATTTTINGNLTVTGSTFNFDGTTLDLKKNSTNPNLTISDTGNTLNDPYIRFVATSAGTPTYSMGVDKSALNSFNVSYRTDTSASPSNAGLFLQFTTGFTLNLPTVSNNPTLALGLSGMTFSIASNASQFKLWNGSDRNRNIEFTQYATYGAWLANNGGSAGSQHFILNNVTSGETLFGGLQKSDEVSIFHSGRTEVDGGFGVLVRGNLKVTGTTSVGTVTGTGAALYRDASTGILAVTPSDIRVKQNIEQIPNALEIVKNLRGVYFNWKDSGDFQSGDSSRQIGFIAQEVESYLPEAVILSGNKDYKTVKYSEMTSVLVESIKEQQKIIEELKTEITNLKLRVTNLES